MNDRGFIERAVAEADVNALRVALFQVTRDPEIAGVAPERVPGAVADTIAFADADVELIRSKAVGYLLAGATPEAELPKPSSEEVDELVQMLEARAFTAEELSFRREIPAFPDVPYRAEWTGAAVVPEGYRVAIIGAGIAGVAMGVQLVHLGIPFTIYERRSEVGGVWSSNTYPDAGVDTLSASYEYGFEKRYPWPAFFARQTDVRAYIEHVARKYGVYEHISFGRDVTTARFDEDTSTWGVTVRDREGTLERTSANVVVAASGIFAQPRELPIEGAAEFSGDIVHSAQWREDLELAGKRVAMIGNGSTGVQMLAQVADTAASVAVYQRTPQWISPRANYGRLVTDELQWLIDTMPFYWNWNKYVAAMGSIELRRVLTHDADWVAGGGQVSERNDALRKSITGYIEREVGGRQELIDKLVPDYAPMTRRPVVDNSWYATLTREHVELVSSGIERITPTGVVAADGTVRDTDVIIAATGFQADRFVWPTEYYGRDGVSLEEAWQAQGAQAYLGMTVPGFPNLFMLYGPNSQPVTGGAGLPSWFEVWSSYIAQGLVTTLEGGHAAIEVRRATAERYNELLHEEAQKLIYLSEAETMGRNYYVNAHGRLQMNAPWTAERFFSMCESLRRTDYEFTPQTPAPQQLLAGAGTH